MWLKIIMILISLFIIYHLFYDMKIWSNGGPLIEEMSTASSGGEEETLGLTEEEVRELIPAAAGAAVAAGLNEIIDAHMPEESKKTQDLTVISQDLGQKEQSELTNHSHVWEPNQISGTVSVDYCDVIDESTTDDVLGHKNLIPDDMDINVYNKSQVIRVGNNFIEILKGIRNLHNVPTMKESDLETLGASVINLKKKNSDNILKNKIIQNVCSMISGIHSNSVDWDTPKLEIKQITTGMFDDNGNTKFNQGDKATENSRKLEEQGLCLWKGCQTGPGEPVDSVWSVY
jgi:hypothetical protein